jgi:hypothetical protein
VARRHPFVVIGQTQPQRRHAGMAGERLAKRHVRIGLRIPLRRHDDGARRAIRRKQTGMHLVVRRATRRQRAGETQPKPIECEVRGAARRRREKPLAFGHRVRVVAPHELKRLACLRAVLQMLQSPLERKRVAQAHVAGMQSPFEMMHELTNHHWFTGFPN